MSDLRDAAGPSFQQATGNQQGVGGLTNRRDLPPIGAPARDLRGIEAFLVQDASAVDQLHGIVRRLSNIGDRLLGSTPPKGTENSAQAVPCGHMDALCRLADARSALLIDADAALRRIEEVL